VKIGGTDTTTAPLNVFPTTAGDDEGSFQVDGAMIGRGSAGHAIAVTGVRRADMRTCHFISYGRMRPTNHSTCSFFAIFGIVSNVLGHPGVETIEFPGEAVKQGCFHEQIGFESFLRITTKIHLSWTMLRNGTASSSRSGEHTFDSTISFRSAKSSYTLAKTFNIPMTYLRLASYHEPKHRPPD
jgi:hypothetical protein